MNSITNEELNGSQIFQDDKDFANQIQNNRSKTKAIKGIGGWLYLVAAGIIFSPILIMSGILEIQKLFNDPGIVPYLDINSPYFNRDFYTLIFGELFYNLGLFVGYVYLGYLFFSKNRWCPRIYIALSVINLVAVFVDPILVERVAGESLAHDPDVLREKGKAILNMLIWVPYMLFSNRVRNTFIN